MRNVCVSEGHRTTASFGTPKKQGTTKCGNKRCGVCNILIEGSSYSFKNTPKPFEIRRDLTCNSKNVIYVIECTNCREQYIGCTNSLNHRVALHKSNVRIPNNMNLFVSKHLFECNDGDFKIIPIYQTEDYNILTPKEQECITKYKPSLNRN